MSTMPVLFVGHGSPMNAIENNVFTENWINISKQIPKPKAILCISAHWFTNGSKISDAEQPAMVYDMYGFPEELYKVEYPVKGSPEFAKITQSLILKNIQIDNSWGIDHGTWSVLNHMYPSAEIPVFQLSVDSHAPASVHYQMGRDIRSLREQGVLIIGSGNIVHNLSLINWDTSGGEPWAEAFDLYIKEHILLANHESIIKYKKAGGSSKLAVPSAEHFLPLLYVLGASYESDAVTVFNEACVMGSMSMTSYLLSR